MDDDEWVMIAENEVGGAEPPAPTGPAGVLAACGFEGAYSLQCMNCGALHGAGLPRASGGLAERLCLGNECPACKAEIPRGSCLLVPTAGVKVAWKRKDVTKHCQSPACPVGAQERVAPAAKANCRACGMVVCDAATCRSATEIPVAGYGDDPQIVCAACYRAYAYSDSVIVTVYGEGADVLQAVVQAQCHLAGRQFLGGGEARPFRVHLACPADTQFQVAAVDQPKGCGVAVVVHRRADSETALVWESGMGDAVAHLDTAWGRLWPEAGQAKEDEAAGHEGVGLRVPKGADPPTFDITASCLSNPEEWADLVSSALIAPPSACKPQDAPPSALSAASLSDTAVKPTGWVQIDGLLRAEHCSATREPSVPGRFSTTAAAAGLHAPQSSLACLICGQALPTIGLEVCEACGRYFDAQHPPYVSVTLEHAADPAHPGPAVAAALVHRLARTVLAAAGVPHRVMSSAVHLASCGYCYAALPVPEGEGGTDDCLPTLTCTACGQTGLFTPSRPDVTHFKLLTRYISVSLSAGGRARPLHLPGVLGRADIPAILAALEDAVADWKVRRALALYGHAPHCAQRQCGGACAAAYLAARQHVPVLAV